MSSTSQAILSSWTFDPNLVLALAVSLILYLRGWVILHRSSPQRFPAWRALAFTGGLTAFWLAIASPLDAFSGLLLSAHMVQHLLLLSVAPPLILLGAPLLPLLRGLPRKFARDGVGPFLIWPALRRAGNAITYPVTCWIIMAITLCAWHVPAAFDLALRSPGWHKLEHACFFGASLLFWWPVVRPFPSRPHWPLWSVPLYLLAADLLNTAISAILTFSDHALYPHYLEVPRLFGTNPVSDQTCAGVLMWVPGSLVFLIPAASIAIQYLSPAHLLVRPRLPSPTLNLNLSLNPNPNLAPNHQPTPSSTASRLFHALIAPRSHPLVNTGPSAPLISTPLKRGGWKPNVLGNRFNGFRGLWKPVKYLFSVVQSQRDCVLQPRVVPQGGKLPWVGGQLLLNPEGVPSTPLNRHTVKAVPRTQAEMIPHGAFDATSLSPPRGEGKGEGSVPSRFSAIFALFRRYSPFGHDSAALRSLRLCGFLPQQALATVPPRREMYGLGGPSTAPPKGGTPNQMKLGRGAVPSRFDLLSVPVLGPFLRAQSGRRFLQAALLILAIAVIIDGLFGPQVSSANLAGVLPWTYWRVFVVIALLAAGNFFCMACPFMLVRDLGRRLGLRQRPWPRALRSKWLAVALLVLFFWAYEAFNLWDKPIWTAWLIINYFLVAFAIDALFSGASFCKYVCPIGQFQFVASLVSPLEVKVRDSAVCASCKTHDCLRGNALQRGCETGLYLPRKSGNLDCTFCLDCVRACPHDNVGIMASAPGLDVVRDPQRSSIGRFSRRTDIAALGLVFVFAAFANAAMMVAPISNWRDHLATSLNLSSVLPVTSALFFLALILAPVILVSGSVLAGKALAGMKAPTRELIRRFCLALVPLAAGMWAAHFLFHFLVGWKSAWPIFQRVAGDLGLAAASQYPFSASGLGLRMDNVRLLQTLLLDLGLLSTLYLSWRIARVYAPKLRLAFRVMVPWGSVAVALYLFGVWTCFQPMQMRGLPGP